MDDRRTGPRRETDLEEWRLRTLETLIETLQDELSVTQLDQRYMPRTELEQVFMPRKEQAMKRTLKTDTSIKLGLALIASGQFALALIVAFAK